MSEREKHENPGKPSAPDHSKQYMAPRRFVFNVPDVQNEEKIPKPNRNFQIFQIPLIHDFPHPLNVKEAYEGICRYILESYSEIAKLISTVCLEDVQDIVKTMKVQKPADCIRFLRDIAVRFCTKMRENRQKKNTSNNGDEYEKLLQQSETKIRELIRNEQIYRLNFEQLTTKGEDAEKLLIEAQIKLEDNKNTIEHLTKETARITAAFHAKDEELRSLALERKAYLQQNFNSNAAATTANTDSPQVVESLRTKTQSWNSQNLKMLLSDNRLTPTEFSKLIPNLESSRVLQSIKSTNRTPTSTKTKTLQRSGTTLDVTSMNLKNLKISGIEKLKESTKDNLVKSQVGTSSSTDRRKAEVLRSSGINHTGRGLEYGFISHSRGASCQTISLVQDQSKSKSAARLKARKDAGGRLDDKSLSPTKIKHHDEPATTLIKTDSFDDHGKSKSLIVVDHGAHDDFAGLPVHVKVDTAHQINNYRRRSGVARTRPLISEANHNTQSQKSLEQRSLMSNTSKHPSASTILSHRSISKGKHTHAMVDSHGKPISKNANSPFVNIMLKRFTDQDITATKKTLINTQD